MTQAVPEESIGFLDGPSVDVREVDPKNWSVLREFKYQGQNEVFTVAVKEPTDFASVPRAFVWFIPTYGKYTKAAILHDYLCRRAEEGSFLRREADGIFRQAMRTLEVAFLRRWIMWAAVRWGAVLTTNGRKQWSKDALLVLVISVPTLLFVAVPALLILVKLLVWHGIELIAYGFLRLSNRVKATNAPRKRVNKPTLSLKT